MTSVLILGVLSVQYSLAHGGILDCPPTLSHIVSQELREVPFAYTNNHYSHRLRSLLLPLLPVAITLTQLAEY